MLRRLSCADVALRSLLREGQWIGLTSSDQDVVIQGCTDQADQVQQGDVFVAVLGDERDGHDDAARAAQRGAAAIVAERLLPVAGPQVLVADSRRALARIAAALASAATPSTPLVAVAGTHGKTSAALLLGRIWEQAGLRGGTHTSLGASDGRSARASLAESALDVGAWLGALEQSQAEIAALEVSDLGLMRQSYAACSWDIATLTNLKRSESEFGPRRSRHDARDQLLSQLKPGGCLVVNADDSASRQWVAGLNAPVLRFGMHLECDIRARILERHSAEQTFLLSAGGESAVVRTRIIGDSHVYNCLAAAATALLQGISLLDIVAGLEATEYLPCRLQRVECGQPFGVFLDSARTPERLGHALHALRSAVGGKVWCVLGAELDASPRQAARLGRVAERFSDRTVITSACHEAPAPLESAHRVMDGWDNVAKPWITPDRQRAVEWALGQAGAGDAVLIAGCRPEWLSLDGCVAEAVESQWCRDFLQGEPPLASPAPVTYPIWQYRNAA